MAQCLASSSQTLSQFIRPMSLLGYTSKSNTGCVKKKLKHWEGKDCMQRQLFQNILVLLVIFLSVSHANAFTSLSLVAGNQVGAIHLIWLQQHGSNPKNEPSCKPIRESTKRMDLDAELPNNLSLKKTWVAYSEPKQDAELPSKITDLTITQPRGLYHS